MRNEPTKHTDLKSEPPEPWIGVHTLSEFVFCSRAGICSHDNAACDDGEELNDRPGFYHLPIFFEEEMIRRQKELIVHSWSCIGFGALLMSGTVLLGWAVHPIFYFAAIFCGIVAMAAFLMQAFRLGELKHEMKGWREANSKIPHVDITEPTEIHWPNFHVAGYRPERPRHPMEEPAWRLRGSPWRMLRLGKQLIPVFLRNIAEDCAARSASGSIPHLYDQHFIRIAAYCHLVEASEGLHAPYGIILTRGSLKGIAIPNTSEMRERLRAAVSDARRTMRKLAGNDRMCPVVDPSHCVGCPHGNPVPLGQRFPGRETDQEAEPGVLQVHFATAPPKQGDKRLPRRYHSHCGDRFTWLPPHVSALRLHLKEE